MAQIQPVLYLQKWQGKVLKLQVHVQLGLAAG